MVWSNNPLVSSRPVVVWVPQVDAWASVPESAPLLSVPCPSRATQAPLLQARPGGTFPSLALISPSAPSHFPLVPQSWNALSQGAFPLHSPTGTWKTCSDKRLKRPFSAKCTFHARYVFLVIFFCILFFCRGFVFGRLSNEEKSEWNITMRPMSQAVESRCWLCSFDYQRVFSFNLAWNSLMNTFQSLKFSVIFLPACQGLN